MKEYTSGIVYELLNVTAEAKNDMENFLNENEIPFSIVMEGPEHIAYSIRAGMDYNDAKLYHLKNFGNLQNPDTVNTINLLVLEHEYLDVQYEYEHCAKLQKDESLLGTFMFRDDEPGANRLN